jgi:hypothetical protein
MMKSMRLFSNLSIKRKIIVLAMFSTGMALLVACLMFMAFDVLLCREVMF